MSAAFRAIALTLFPEMFPGSLGYSLAGQGLAKGLWELKTINIRDFAENKHKTVDDTPYGGGTGMVMRPDVLEKAIIHAKSLLPQAQIIYFTPRGEVLNQARVRQFMAQRDVILLCGRFEGVDQRIIEHFNMVEVSLGDFILSGGELAALALLDACVRLIPGVIGNESALAEESFNSGDNFAGLLEYPHYTKPPFWQGKPVPEVLLSGHHKEIEKWRYEQAENITQVRRPDLWERYTQRKD